jgi:MYXO-CTERM domain-containing protein
MQNIRRGSGERRPGPISAAGGLVILACLAAVGCGAGSPPPCGPGSDRDEQGNCRPATAAVGGQVSTSARALQGGLPGTACTAPGDCASNFCVDGVCCLDGCGGGVVTDCQACSMAAGSTFPDGTCGFLAMGVACSDGSACTSGDTCNVTGMCVPGTATVCMEEPCKDAGLCNPTSGLCENPNKMDGTVCEDNNMCTAGTTCTAGVCGAVAMTCMALSPCHDVGVCEPATGMCTNPVKMNGVACDDNNACTRMDTCQMGMCTGSNPVVCGASDQCHADGVCNMMTGMCSNPNEPDGTDCDDDNMCTVMDTCTNGVCTMGTPLNCNDNNPCTTDSCDPDMGCVRTPVPNCPPDAAPPDTAPDTAIDTAIDTAVDTAVDTAPTDARLDTAAPTDARLDTVAADVPPTDARDAAVDAPADRAPDLATTDATPADAPRDTARADARDSGMVPIRRVGGGGGCDCDVGGRPPGRLAQLPVLLGLAALLLRRRRRR